MIYHHTCKECRHQSSDAEKILVCPDCSSSEITNECGAIETEYDEKELEAEVHGDESYFDEATFHEEEEEGLN